MFCFSVIFIVCKIALTVIVIIFLQSNSKTVTALITWPVLETNVLILVPEYADLVSYANAFFNAAARHL